MSLKRRKIVKVIQAHAPECAEEFNSALGTKFEFDFGDWSCIPAGVEDWNWEHEDLKALFKISFFGPIRKGLDELFQDDFYKDEINSQIKTFRFEGGKTMQEYSFADGVMTLKHDMGVNQKGDGGMFFSSFVNSFKDAVENGLA